MMVITPLFIFNLNVVYTQNQLYYHLNDPTGTSVTLLTQNGTIAGRMLYDGYGSVLNSTVSPNLTTALAGVGAVAEPDTGLAYLGNGRYYDPQLGRPLQPNASGGIPVVPQSLNRYAATGVGQPGVAAGAKNGLNLWPDVFGWVKGATIDVLGLQSIVTGYKYVGYAEVTVQASRSALLRKIPTDLQASFGTLRPTNRMSILERSGRVLIGGGSLSDLEIGTRKVQATLIAALPNQDTRWKAVVSVLDGVVDIERIPQQRLLVGKLAGFRYLKFGLGPAFDAILGGYLQYRADGGNPFLSPGQKRLRALTSGVGSLLTGLGVAAIFGCTVSVVCGIAAGVTGTAVWVFFGQPLIFNTILPGLSQQDRRLKRLSIS